MNSRIELLESMAHVRALQTIQSRSGILFRQVGMDDIADNPPTDSVVFEKAIHDELLYSALVENQIAGFVLALNHGEAYHLEQMSVDPSFARRGVGAQSLKGCYAHRVCENYFAHSI